MRAELDTQRILLKAQKAIPAEEIAGEGVPREPPPVDAEGLLRVEIVHAGQEIGRPCHLELDGTHLEPGIALEDPPKDHRRQGDADIMLFVGPLDDVRQGGVGAVRPGLPAPGARMQAQGHGQVLSGGP